MPYSLSTLWHERNRYLAGVLAVAFSAVLIALQGGLLLGLFSITSLPIDRAGADIWVGSANVLSVDLGRPIAENFLARLALQPEVEQAEVYVQGFSHWNKPHGGAELCCIIGSRLDEQSLGAPAELPPALRTRLTEPGAVAVDAAELGRLGIEGVGDIAEVNGHRLRVVGLVHGLKSLAGPYVFCSLGTARNVLHLPKEQATYLLARCRPDADQAALLQRLQHYPSLSAASAATFSARTRWHWLTQTKAGIALGCAAVLGLVVGAVVTSQTLYAATLACQRELAVLSALGIPHWRMAAHVVTQSFWIGVMGIGLSVPVVAVLAWLAGGIGAKVLLPGWLVGSVAIVTLLMALLAGLSALRSLRLVEPSALLR